jgi:hypothetical protein
MHTYRKAENGGWKVVHDGRETWVTGPTFELECEAAAYASFLNGGRYCPDEIAPIFAVHPVDEEDDDVHPARPKSMEDYPIAPKAK